MPAERTEPPVTAFILVRTTPEWLALTVQERVDAFTTQVLPAVRARTTGVRSRFYDTEFYSARVTDVWVWEADDHHAHRLLVDALRETPFWDRYFEVVDLLVGTENGYARTYGLEPVATVST
ncbi:darcynin family protein [Streptomyces sp. NRRL B-24484]|uniref:darcynin family protein n=1 Tax=Streptomyces sp. NRRL B-24484 TaxID=1463833 RepID=UPI0004C020ED|nr:darcynin family protein [Streptomyces sp. NRRL B-24484]